VIRLAHVCGVNAALPRDWQRGYSIIETALVLNSLAFSYPKAFMLVPFAISDFDEVLALWQRTEGVGLNESDTRENIAGYLPRNPGMSFVV
jgi:hypothetical protein